MRKKVLSIILVTFMSLSLFGCGASKNQDKEDSAVADNGDGNMFSEVTTQEAEALADNELYIANASGFAITDVYIVPSGSPDLGRNLISEPVETGEKVIVSVEPLKAGTTYDICIADSDSNTTQYSGFDIQSTVQVIFYDDARCDVSTI